MSTTAKLKAPKGVSVISVAGQEYKVVKGYVAVLIEHLEHLVGMGFTGADDEELVAAGVDPQLPAGVTSNLVLPGSEVIPVVTAAVPELAPAEPAAQTTEPVVDAAADDGNAPAPADDAVAGASTDAAVPAGVSQAVPQVDGQ
ncbi:hypothetical protein [Herbaspirillum sp. RV1423]|uniref:hypothetical protein n=1 Tax=Herbaspirillum sp. RV1423 TaxID=1443993 RepID=UPI00054E4A98|nr:hypothetical protein [Herbaspirillum sp. RV1423]